MKLMVGNNCIDTQHYSKKRGILRGEVPSPIDPPPGCAFGHRVGHERYPESIGMDLKLEEIEPGHFVQNCPCCVG